MGHRLQPGSFNPFGAFQRSVVGGLANIFGRFTTGGRGATPVRRLPPTQRRGLVGGAEEITKGAAEQLDVFGRLGFGAAGRAGGLMESALFGAGPRPGQRRLPTAGPARPPGPVLGPPVPPQFQPEDPAVLARLTAQPSLPRPSPERVAAAISTIPTGPTAVRPRPTGDLGGILRPPPRSSAGRLQLEEEARQIAG